MSIEEQYRSILSEIAAGAESFLESIAETVTGKPDPLRDGSEHDPVELPRDLWAHDNAQTEWWYYTGHAETAAGRRFGFELVFFKRRTDLDKFSLIPLRLLGNPIYFAHFAVTEPGEQRFRYEHRKSSNGRFELPASASDTHFHLQIGDWTLRESHGMHVLRANIGSDLVFEATLAPAKPVVLNGEAGVSFKDEGEASRYFSYTRMEMEGDMRVEGNVEHFTGSAWMDREFGTWTPTENQKGWDWFSIQLANDCELMCYQLRNSEGGISPYSSGTFVDANGVASTLLHSDFDIVPSGTWRSNTTGTEYPSGWTIKVPSLGLDLRIEPELEDQELDTRGTTMIIYWEGACRVIGTHYGSDIAGKAYVELVGYDRSHEQPNLAYFLIGSSFDNLTGWISK